LFTASHAEANRRHPPAAMRPSPHLPARVVWQEGMYLAPHHFQAQRRHFEDSVALALRSLVPYEWGVAAAALDEEALRNGTLAVREARGILPDGTPFAVPDADEAPAPAALAERFSPTRDAHVVCLTLPAWRPDAANVGSNGSAGALRWRVVPREVVDEVSGTDTVAVEFAAKNLRLALDDEVQADDVALPIARLRRDGAGHFVIDPDYIPPCVRIEASPRLLALLHAIVGMLEAKGAALAQTVGAAGSAGPAAAPAPGAAGPVAYTGNEVAARWLLHAVRSAEAPLRHLLATRGAHPERLWDALSRLAGALCTFSLTAQARDLPTYQHDDLAGCFGALERHIRQHLDVVVAARAVVMPLARSTDTMHVTPVTDARCFQPGARWYLAVKSSVGPTETSARVPVLAKACASKFVMELVRRAYPGLPLEHIPAPPPTLAPRPDRTYFAMTLTGPCAQALTDSREFGVYVPDGIPDATLELVVQVAN
jgi:type VI secretion system protein ImpJ